MATKTYTRIYCDLCESEGGTSTLLAVDGRTTSVDLCDKHRAALDKALASYVEAGRTQGRAKRASAGKTATAELAAIRSWANANGVEVSARGRIPAEVRAQWEAAGSPL